MAFVNWWESQTRLIPMPLRWKERWHRELMPTVAAWAGDVQLQATAFYGMRVYADASWLIRHVDREDTHALSAIMNLDQSDDVEAAPPDATRRHPTPPEVTRHPPRSPETTRHEP